MKYDTVYALGAALLGFGAGMTQKEASIAVAKGTMFGGLVLCVLAVVASVVSEVRKMRREEREQKARGEITTTIREEKR